MPLDFEDGESETTEEEVNDLTELSLDDLMDVQVVVSGSKYEQPIDRSPTAINILTARDIRLSGAKTIADLLKRFPGVWTWTKTRSDYDIGMLGLLEDENPRVLYLLDGQPISTPMFEGMQWPQFPITLEEVERIEVVRGGGSALYGANALTGVINIITKAAADRKNETNSYIGEDGIQQHTFSLARSFDNLDLAITGGWRQTQKRGSWDPTFNLGEQDYYRTPVFNAKMDYAFSEEQRVSLFGGYSMGDGGYPASPGDRSIDRVQDWEHMILQGNYENTVMEDTDFHLKGSYYRINQQNFRPYQTGNPEKYHVNGIRYNLESYLITEVIPRNKLLFGGSIQNTMTNSIGDTSNLAPARRYDYNMRGVYLQDEWAITDSLSAIGSVRHDAYDDVDDELTSRGTLMYYFDDKNTLRFSAGKSYRRAAIYTQHYQVIWPGGYLRGTPGLESQTSLNYELEYRTRLIPDHTLKLEVFQLRLKDVYFNNFVGPGPQIEKFTTDNEYLIRGFMGELEGYLIKEELKWYSNITLYHAKDDTAHLRMVDVPKHMFNAGMQYTPCEEFYLSLDAHHQDGFKAVVDSTVTDSVNGIPGGTSVGSFTSVDSKVGYYPWEDIEVSVSVENLFNDRHYEFPLHSQRGRTVYLGVRIVW